MTSTRSLSDLLPELAAQADIRALTALLYHDDRAERVFTSHAEIFAGSGFKLFADAPTMARVRDTGAPILTKGEDALRAGFPDAQSILDLGADAIVNLPVRTENGEVVGQVNLMGGEEAFDAARLEALQTVADSFSCCFLRTDTKKGAPCD
ncbi:GAF domain-containing protein [Pseudodonghicola xiamenensis]|uniref:GAF domain-containing protein n=1 Tax=Pseudodonghicola xiamenensis TaxID=337702 RepID=A0A8J3MFV2_9RHOB|nr:GAF domain-containing protein [Pseudodonghicola xiamenensis]GHG97072.1 hypothetical protein GCM10010961_31660 [Pseudodonghicola xiamenensis]